MTKDAPEFPGHIDIRPGVSILSVLRHLNYKPWYALAEFVDNALDSYLKNRERLFQTDGLHRPLEVRITVDPGREGHIRVWDNAAGISLGDYARAFRAAEVPPDTSGLSEFGMGMKSAACWFANEWSVRSSAIGEPVERTVTFNMAEITRDQRDHLAVTQQKQLAIAHYTEITLRQLHRSPPSGRTLGKVREHLASMYRTFLRDGTMVLEVAGEKLRYEEPDILGAPPFQDSSSPAVVWRKEIDFDFGLGVWVSGFAALRAKGSTVLAGFALFRRGRLIQGSGDESYRPARVFGASNSYAFQRLFGELHIEGLPVTHTKDGFQWGEDEEAFLDILKEHLDSEPLPLLRQAEGYRARRERSDYETVANHVLNNVERALTTSQVIGAPQGLAENPELVSSTDPFHASPQTNDRTLSIVWEGNPWEIHLQLSNDPSLGDWIDVYQYPTGPATPQAPAQIGIRLSMAHPFTVRWIGANDENLEPLVRVATALALAEVLARYGGVGQAGSVRRNLNALLSGPLSTS